MRAIVRAQRGQAMPEFALASTFLVTLLVGIAQLGTIYYAQLAVQTGAREGARVVVSNPGNTGMYSGANSPSSPGSHTCTGAADPVKACKAVFNSTHGGTLGGLISPSNLTVTLGGSSFRSTVATTCPSGTGTSDGLITVTVAYNAPLFVPIVNSIFATGSNNYRTVTSIVKGRVEPCINTGGG